MAIMVARARSGCWGSKPLAGGVLLLSAAAGGALAGGLAGALGAALPVPARTVLVMLALAALVAAAAAGRRPTQLDRETPQSWLRYGDARTAALNGLALGSGVSTRIGFWSFHLAVVAVTAAGDWALGALALAAFGVARIGSSLVLAGTAFTTEAGRRAVMDLYPVARTASTVLVLCLAPLLALSL